MLFSIVSTILFMSNDEATGLFMVVGSGRSRRGAEGASKFSPLAFVFKQGTEGFNILQVGFTFRKSTK